MAIYDKYIIALTCDNEEDKYDNKFEDKYRDYVEDEVIPKIDDEHYSYNVQIKN